MKSILILGGVAAIVPYFWDNLALQQFTASQGQTELFTFSGSLSVLDWEKNLAIAGGILLIVITLLVLI
jgi:hypothetical protein